MVDEFECKEIDNIVTPINAEIFELLLRKARYDEEKITKLIEGFTAGFDIGYEGLMNRKDFSDNIPFTISDSYDMWNKIMKEVGAGRYAGPFSQDEIPYDHFVQSPIGLVLKSGGKTRLIFHLSYDFGTVGSSNHHTDKTKCTVHYKDLDYAIDRCVGLLNQLNSLTGINKPVIYYTKTDLVSAFRLLPIRPDQKCLLLMKA